MDWGRGEQGGRGGGEESTGSLWRVENQQEVAPLGPGGPILQLPGFTCVRTSVIEFSSFI